MNISHSTHNHDNIFSHLFEELLESIGAGHELSEFFIHFISDTINIFILLFFIMFIVSFLQTYINFENLKERLVKLNNIWSYLFAVCLGVISPFCSCTIVPVLIGLINMGIPVSLAICFFTSASLLNIAAILTMSATIGYSFTIQYVMCSLLTVAVVSLCMSRFNIGASAKIYSMHQCCEHSHNNNSIRDRAYAAIHNTKHVFAGAWIYIVIGVVISSATMVFVPFETLAQLINNKFSVIIAAIIGLPIHSDVFTILPIVLVLKELSNGVALAFTLATMSISLPSVILLSRAFRAKVILIYTIILFVLSVAIGYICILI